MMNPTVRFGAVFNNRKSYRAVWCGYGKTESLRAVRFCDVSYGPVRFDSVPRRIVFCYGAVSIPEGKKSYNTHLSLRCTVDTNRMKPLFLTVLRLFIGAPTKPLFLYGAPYE